MANKTTSALATLRHIATLGYPAKAVMPALLDAFRAVVPYDNANFIWMDEDCNAVDMHNFTVAPEPVVRLCQERWFNRRDALYVPSHRMHMRSLLVDRSATVQGFAETEFYDEIFRPSGYRSYLRLSVRDGTRPIGVFHFYREFSSRDFSAADEQQALRVLPWLTHALATPTAEMAEEELLEGESGMLIADRDGEVHYFSREARQLLHQVAEIPINAETLADRRLAWAQPLLRTLARSLEAARDDAVPVRYFSNPAGYFRVRAYWLDGAAGRGSETIAIYLQRQLPLTLKLLQSPTVRALPNRERQACLMLARGHSTGEIAKHMEITGNGAVYHVRSLYNRLGISRREELVPSLLGALQ